MPRGGSNQVTRPQGFYEAVLSQAERTRLKHARTLEGLDEEIALLRMKLSQLAQENPEKLELLLKGIGLLVRAVATRYRLSPQAKKDLLQSALGVVQGIGDALWPEGFDGAR